MAKKTKLVHQFIEEISRIYPLPLRRFLQKVPFTLRPSRFVGGEQIDGSYDIETGEIILWGPKLEDREGLFLVITHEWGHKIYHEWSDSREIEEWLLVRSLEKIDFDLKKAYPAVKHPEKEFCTLFSLVSLVKYWDKIGMKAQSKKLSSKLQTEFDLASRTIEKHISKRARPFGKSGNHITHREVERLKACVHKIIAG